MVSVIMTTYNGEKYLLEQLESLRMQSIPIDEVLISDDGSTDNTVDIADGYISKYELLNWRIIKNKENKGWRRNFVETTSMAQGDLIFFCDQDDIWCTRKIEVMKNVMIERSDINVLAGRYIKFTDKKPEESCENKGVHKVKLGDNILYTELPGCVYCVRKSFWNQIIKFWNGVFSHDAICWAASKLNGTAYILEMPVIYWRKHYGSTYTVVSREVKTNEKRIEWLERAQKNTKCLELICKELRANNESEEKIQQYETFLETRLEMLKKHKPLLALKLLRYIKCYDRKRQLILEIYLALKH